MTRPNRAQRRDVRVVKHRNEVALMQLRETERAAILPGLPGSLHDYVSHEQQEAFMEEHFDALAAMHPGMVWRAEACTRMVPLGIPAVEPVRVRHVRAAAPDGLGQGVVLGEFTTAAPERPSRVILPGKDRDAIRREIIWPGSTG